MSSANKLTTKGSFINGRYVPRGFPVTVDTAKLSGRERNLVDFNPDAVAPVETLEMSAVAPTGPNPKRPQQVPNNATETIEGHVLPGAVLVGEVTVPAAERIDAAGIGKGAGMQAAAADLMSDDNDALVEGSLAEIIPTLGDKSVEELRELRAAELEHEKPRKGLTAAIDRELATRAEA